MALSGLQIQKLLPKTNCKECGSNTCLAFAMKIAAKKANLSECPYVSEEAKQILGADSEPPVKSVTFGSGVSVKLGEETVLYRHEKTFVNQTAIAVNIDDNVAGIDATLARIRDYELVRVGQTLKIDAVAITQKSGDDGVFADLCKKASEVTKLPLVIRAAGNAGCEKAARAVRGTNSIIANVCPMDADFAMKLAAENGHNLAVTGETVDDIVTLTHKLKDTGFNNLVLQFNAESLAQEMQLNTIARTAALKNNFKPLGYPHLTFIGNGDLADDTIQATIEITKYGGVIVLPSFDASQLATLMTLRLNIFTDPQKPIQVEPKLYPIGEPNRESPIFVTTNFSLTYFIVSGEIENAGISAWLIIPECEGFSVLTAWAAGKFSGAMIGKFVKEIGLEDAVDTRQIVIPGYVSQISGELEESLPGWKILVGPQDAGDLESFIKAVL